MLTEAGDPFSGVSVVVKNSNIGTQTDAQGNFSLDVLPNAVLIVSHVGYEEKKILLNGRTNLSISLTPSVAGVK